MNRNDRILFGSGFIGGMKILLPENTERINEKDWEEVKIPINPPAPNGLKKKLVQINDLDPVSNLKLLQFQLRVA